MRHPVTNPQGPLLLMGAALVVALTARAGWLLLPLDSLQANSAHLFMELACIGMAAQIVTLAWNSLDLPGRGVARSLIFGFALSAGLSLAHVFGELGLRADAGVRAWFEPDTLAVLARAAEAITLCAVAWRMPFGGKSRWWLALVLPVALVLYQLGLAYPQLLNLSNWWVAMPLTLLLLLAASRFHWRLHRDQQPRMIWNAVACLCLALSLQVLAGLDSPHDHQALTSHALRLMGLVLALRAVMTAAMAEPYTRLLDSEHRLHERERQLNTVLDHVPAGVARVDLECRVLYANARQARRLRTTVDEIQGRALQELIHIDQREKVMEGFHAAFRGETTVLQSHSTRDDGSPLHTEVTVVPERDERGVVLGAVSFGIDITDEVLAQQELMASLRDISELSAALDEHAIVAVTDARGVITQVNDKFCAISQYRRDELVGRTHHLVNSGEHEPGFFGRLWAVISVGKVWQGDICNRAKDGSLYWVQTTIVPQLDAQGVPRQYVAIRTDITERRRTEAEIRQLALYDPLTDLPNRRLLTERIDHTRHTTTRSGQHAALLLIDLDHFKAINDTHGHDHGDVVLCGVSRRLQAGLRQSDTPARLGGDEFVVLLQNLGEDPVHASGVAAEMAELLRIDLGRPHEHAGQAHTCTPSIGMTVFCGGKFTVDDLLKQADVALYQAKTVGRNRIQFFDPRAQAAANERQDLASDLIEALDTGKGLCLLHEAVVDRERQRIGCQLHLCWEHPRLGPVGPERFAPAVESAGMSLRLWFWMLAGALDQLQRWQADPATRNLSVGLALGAKVMANPDFLREFEEQARTRGADLRSLVLELEPACLARPESGSMNTLERLKALGPRCSVSVDELTPLGVLLRGQPDELKVHAQQNLPLEGPWDVVVYGVDSEALWNLWLARRASAFQGSLLGMPGVPA